MALYNVFTYGSMKPMSALSPGAPAASAIKPTPSAKSSPKQPLAAAPTNVKHRPPSNRGTSERPACARCGEPLRGEVRPLRDEQSPFHHFFQVIDFKGVLFHDACFKCVTCSKAI